VAPQPLDLGLRCYILTTPKFVFSFGIDIDAAPLDQTEPTEFAEDFAPPASAETFDEKLPVAAVRDSETMALMHRAIATPIMSDANGMAERYGDLSGDHGLLPDHKSAIGSSGIGLASGRLPMDCRLRGGAELLVRPAGVTVDLVDSWSSTRQVGVPSSAVSPGSSVILARPRRPTMYRVPRAEVFS
jgi:hypothetical protein